MNGDIGRFDWPADLGLASLMRRSRAVPQLSEVDATTVLFPVPVARRLGTIAAAEFWLGGGFGRRGCARGGIRLASVLLGRVHRMLHACSSLSSPKRRE